MSTPRRVRRHPDAGMTLVELLVSTALMGLLAGALSVVVTTVIKLSPAAEDRNDDANSLLSLTAYMPEDVNSTPAGGFEFDKNLDSGCLQPGTGVNLVRMTWQEITTTTTTYVASYRYEPAGSSYKIIRYTCLAGASARTIDMSEGLPAIDESTWNSGDAPVAVVPNVVSAVFNGLTFNIDTKSGDTFSFEMRTNDLNETLPPVSPINQALIPPGNQVPVAPDVSAETVSVTPVDIGLPAYDPDGDGLTVTISNLPSQWTTSITGLTVWVTPHNSFNSSSPPEVFQYTVADPWGEVATGNITVSYSSTAPVNTPPTAGNVVDVVVAGTDLVINLPVADSDGDPLTVTSTAPPGSGLTLVITGSTLTVSSDGSNLSAQSFSYTVDDGQATATGTIDLTITNNPCNVTSLTPAHADVDLKNNGYLKNTVTFTIAYTGMCTDLVLAFDNNLDDGYQPVYLSFGAGTTVTHQGNNGGLKWTPGTHEMTLQSGPSGPDILDAEMDVNP